MVTLAAMEYDRRRIYSRGLFTRVDIQFDSLGGKRYLLVDVNERWYFFPGAHPGIPRRGPQPVLLRRRPGAEQVGGRNQKLFASLVLGYDPSAGLSFLEPMIDPESRLSLGAGASFSRVSNKSTDLRRLHEQRLRSARLARQTVRPVHERRDDPRLPGRGGRPCTAPAARSPPRARTLSCTPPRASPTTPAT